MIVDLRVGGNRQERAHEHQDDADGPPQRRCLQEAARRRRGVHQSGSAAWAIRRTTPVFSKKTLATVRPPGIDSKPTTTPMSS